MRSAPPPGSLAEASDRALAALIGLGHPGALEELARRHLSALQTHAARILGDDSAAEDVAQQVLEWVWLHRTDWNPACVRAFLLRRVRWLSLNELKRRKASSIREERYFTRAVPRQELPIDSAARAELRRDLSSAIASLPPRQRQAFLLRVLGGGTYQEVADAMNLSPRTAEHYVAMASEKLRASLAIQASCSLPYDPSRITAQ